MRFKNGNEMYDYLHSDRDLYSKSLGVYAFRYNEPGAICIYSLSPKHFAEVVKLSKETGEYWAAHLGWYGNEILDDSDYDEYREVEDYDKWALYAKPSLDFCEETYMVDDWMDTEDVTVEYVMEE